VVQKWPLIARVARCVTLTLTLVLLPGGVSRRVYQDYRHYRTFGPCPRPGREIDARRRQLRLMEKYRKKRDFEAMMKVLDRRREAAMQEAREQLWSPSAAAVKEMETYEAGRAARATEEAEKAAS